MLTSVKLGSVSNRTRLLGYFVFMDREENQCKLTHPALPVLLTEPGQLAQRTGKHWGQILNACSGVS